MAKLNMLFSSWEKQTRSEGDHAGEPLVWLLEHEYTDASLSYAALKGHDQQVGAYMREVCAKYGFYFYLATVKRVVCASLDADEDGEGYGSHEIIEEISKKLNLKRVVDLDGTEVGEDIGIKEEIFIQEEPFDGMSADDEEVEYTGNEGVTATLFYERTVSNI